MKKKGFTLIELLVVISIIAMLLAILMPALGKVKKMAQRLVCGTNLKGLGNAIYVYAFDYEDNAPVQKHYSNWNDSTGAGGGPTTVSASLYLLVRNADVGAKSFVCPSGDEVAFDAIRQSV